MARLRPVEVDGVTLSLSPRSRPDSSDGGDEMVSHVFLSEDQLAVVRKSREESLGTLVASAQHCVATAGVYRCPCGNIVLNRRRKPERAHAAVSGYLTSCESVAVDGLGNVLGAPRRVQKGTVTCDVKGRTVFASCFAHRTCSHPPQMMPKFLSSDCKDSKLDESDTSQREDGMDERDVIVLTSGETVPLKPPSRFPSQRRPSELSTKSLSAISSAPVDIDDVLASRIGAVVDREDQIVECFDSIVGHMALGTGPENPLGTILCKQWESTLETANTLRKLPKPRVEWE